MSDRWRRIGGPGSLLLVLVLGAALWIAPSLDGLTLGDAVTDGGGVDEALDDLEPSPIVLVGFDPDLGTYAEIRPTVRTLLADVLARDGRIAVVSLTPEGRALATAELARLARGEANAARLFDLGFIPGAEAALVDLATGLTTSGGAGGQALGRELAEDGMDAVDAIVVVGGNDLGPRSWVEQVAPRVGNVPILAVTPTILLPEVQPYVESGQIAALLGTVADGAAYRDGAELGNLDRLTEQTEVAVLPILIGLLVAAVAMGQALGARIVGAARSREREVS
ncbi:MAG: hypothetical protein K5924_10095 [Chloroflexi bacterium]|nr:hypothetical protein [Chloroflexota bacterium]